MPTAILLVNNDWMNTGVQRLLTRVDASTSSEGRGHLINGAFDHEDEHGVWLANVEAQGLTLDGSIVRMTRMLVPWAWIYTVGIVETDEKNLKPGFRL